MAERYPTPKSSSPRPPFSIKGQEAFSLTPPSLNSLHTLVQDSQLNEHCKDHDQSQIPNLLPSSNHQTAVSKECVRGLGKEIDRGLACYILKELAILYGDDQFAPLDSSQEEAGNGYEDDHKFKDQEEVMKMAHGVGFLGHQDSLELANMRTLSPRPNEKKEAFFIRKVLTEYDINSDRRLWMTAKEVLMLLPVMNLSADKICKSDEGVTVKIFDTQSKKESTLALRTRFGQYFFCKGWKKKFVNERELKQGDEIELAWDAGAGILNFSVINRAGDNTRVLSPRPNRKEDAFIRKVLNNSHVDYHSELSLGKKEVLEILPHINLNALRPGQSEKVKMLDTHSGEERTMTLRQQSGSRFTLTNLWKKKFVDEHDLKKGDEIKLAWNERTRTLKFSIIGRAVPRGQSSRTA